LEHLALLGPLRSWDEQAAVAVAQGRSPGIDGLMSVLSQLAETESIIAVAVVVLIVLWRQRRWRALPLAPLALGIEVLAFLAVNVAVRRDRPEVTTIGEVPATFSFPSGHVAATFVLYGALVVLVRPRLRRQAVLASAWVGVALLALAVGYARVYRGLHHPVDVAFGLLLGIASLSVSVVALRAAARASIRVDHQPVLDASRSAAHRSQRATVAA
jgi:undecaprenyl-diphosphatase